MHIFGSIGKWIYEHTGFALKFWGWDDEPIVLFAIKLLEVIQEWDYETDGPTDEIIQISLFHLRILRYDLTLTWEPTEEKYVLLVKE